MYLIVLPPLLLFPSSNCVNESDPRTLCLRPSMPTMHRSATIATALHKISALPLHDDLPIYVVCKEAVWNFLYL